VSVRISPSAGQALFDIWDYVADDSVRAADHIIEEFDHVFTLTAENPEMGRLRDEVEDALRSFPVGSYVIFYTSMNEGVTVIRVLHMRRDLEEPFGT
jgi:toxin ParE1/3/4